MRRWFITLGVMLVLSETTGHNAPPDDDALRVSLVAGRTVFQRMEDSATLSVLVTNVSGAVLRDVLVSVRVGDSEMAAAHLAESVPVSGEVTVPLLVDTSLKPGLYDAQVAVRGRTGDRTVSSVLPSPARIRIVPRRLPQVFPVIHWGFHALDDIVATGFTHTELHELRPDYEAIWRDRDPASAASENKMRRTIATLDECLARGLSCTVGLRPADYLMGEPDLREIYQRIDRDGEPYRRPNTCGLFADVQEFCTITGVGAARAYGMHPAFAAVKIHDELRDGSELCFHAHDLEAYRRACGREIPDVVSAKAHAPAEWAAAHTPPDGVVPDDDAVVDYYRWFWREGDGWNTLNSQVAAGVRDGCSRSDIWTWHDPAVRVPPLWGSGGDVDILSHWSYTYPDPLRVALAADELLAMAAGRPGQQVMKMTQILWYRDQVAPRNDAGTVDDVRAEWEIREPDARFITCAPDHLRESIWLKLSRPVRGIMTYGSGCLFGGGQQQRMTNARTRDVLEETIRDIVVPLGPTLLQVPDGTREVAMLESFTSMVYGSQPTWGWARGWAGDVHQLLEWAGLQPHVIYEEHVQRDALAGVRVLVLPDCPVLPRSVADTIRRFQRRGGIVVGDSDLAATITPDVLIDRRRRSVHSAPDRFKKALQDMGAALREELAPVYVPFAQSSEQDVILHRRRYGETDYLFAVNDRRVFGTYVGHHGKVMEEGVAIRTRVTVRRTGVHVYDLVAAAPVTTQESGDGVTSWETGLGPGSGRLYLVSPKPVATVRATVQARAASERRVRVTLTVADPEGTPLAAVIPLEVRVLDPAGQEAEFSGFYGAADGVQNLTLDLAPNDLRGTWTVEARERASGKRARTRFDYR